MCILKLKSSCCLYTQVRGGDVKLVLVCILLVDKLLLSALGEERRRFRLKIRMTTHRCAYRFICVLATTKRSSRLSMSRRSPAALLLHPRLSILTQF